MAMETLSSFECFGTLLTYPDGRIAHELVPSCDALIAQDEVLAQGLAAFRNYVACAEQTDLEEIFTRTFDVNPVCSLELGWHLYGEDYSRGSFLVQMRESMRHVGVEETAELPDHLTHALAVLARLEDASAKGFANAYVQPGLTKMLEGFPDEDNPYRAVLIELDAYLKRQYGAGFERGPARPERESVPYDDCSSGCPVNAPCGGE